MPRKESYCRICGTGIDQTLRIFSHEVKSYPSNTYHIFELSNGAVLWLNDFGVKTLTFADSVDKLN